MDLSNHFTDLDYILIVKSFHRKLSFKRHTIYGIEQLINPEKDKQRSAACENNMVYPIPGELPSCKTVKKQLSELFIKILD